ncbi:MAG: cupredoxin domain-containing protein [Nanoarchaeota archaeon]
MKSSSLYLIGIVFVIVVFGVMMLKGESYQNNSNPTGEYREVILGIKDFNYYPNAINADVGETVRIKLDSSVTGCFRSLTIRDFKINKYLKTSKDYVEFTPSKAGTYGFSCSMGMGTGVIIVK